uniref:Uncharacterized protein n=1 Tax=Amphimedon queenslandica TaxID=400682 RepID=A0A1X7UES7_AMPQE
VTSYNCQQLMVGQYLNELEQTKLGAANAVNIWKKTVEYDELTVNEFKETKLSLRCLILLGMAV